MLVDGKAMAEKMLAELRVAVTALKTAPKLMVFTAAPNFETQKFLAIKKRQADAVGIEIVVVEFPESVTTEECVTSIETLSAGVDGVIVQLPFPAPVEAKQLIAAIPNDRDVDAFHSNVAGILPPVAGAVAAILRDRAISPAGKRVTVVGNGTLVGAPVARLMKEMKAEVTILTKAETDIKASTETADIVVLGAGVPGLLQSDMIKAGAVVLDAGTSEDAGELRGDADPACAAKAAVFTPVPGGIGPITIAVLLQNVVLLAKHKEIIKST